MNLSNSQRELGYTEVLFNSKTQKLVAPLAGDNYTDLKLEVNEDGSIDISQFTTADINLDNPSTFSIPDASGLGTQKDLNEWIVNALDTIYATEAWVSEQGFLTEAPDSPEVNLDGYATEQWVNDQGFLTEGFSGDYNDLTNTPDIPTKTSDLTNDSGFITADDIGDGGGGSGEPQVQSDWTESDASSAAFIKNKLIAATGPDAPAKVEGNLWVDDTSAILYVCYKDQWVPITAGKTLINSPSIGLPRWEGPANSWPDDWEGEEPLEVNNFRKYKAEFDITEGHEDSVVYQWSATKGTFKNEDTTSQEIQLQVAPEDIGEDVELTCVMSTTEAIGGGDSKEVNVTLTPWGPRTTIVPVFTKGDGSGYNNVYLEYDGRFEANGGDGLFEFAVAATGDATGISYEWSFKSNGRPDETYIVGDPTEPEIKVYIHPDYHDFKLVCKVSSTDPNVLEFGYDDVPRNYTEKIADVDIS